VRDPARILIVRLSHLGDVVHALGVFHALHAAFPAAEIGWAIQPEFAGLVRPLPGLARVFPFARREGLGAWRRLAAELSRFRADLAVDAQGNLKSAAVLALSRSPRRVAPARTDWQEPWAAWLASEHAPALPPGERHALQRMRTLVRHLLPESELPLRMDAALDPLELAAGLAALDERLPLRAGGAAGVLVHLSDPRDVRGWPAERWLELLRLLRAGGRSVLVLSGPADEELGRELAGRMPPERGLAHWIGQRGLRELAALFAAAARRGLALVACDSGPMHLAAAEGLRVVALSGPQDPARTGPWPLAGAGPNRVVRARSLPACAPCRKARCRHGAGPVCMSEIQAQDVLAALG
jgi:ADP-heptose:LPS heptosyltransferase